MPPEGATARFRACVRWVVVPPSGRMSPTTGSQTLSQKSTSNREHPGLHYYLLSYMHMNLYFCFVLERYKWCDRTVRSPYTRAPEINDRLDCRR